MPSLFEEINAISIPEKKAERIRESNMNMRAVVTRDPKSTLKYQMEN